VPYHPPAYPGVLALFFSAFGMSYPAARLFVALCSALFLCSFYAVTRKLGLRPVSALACSLLLATTPDVVRWSRDTMSEVPSSAFMMAASLAFLAGLESRSPWKLWSAFALAEVAFLSRVTTIGILPAWFLYAAVRGRLRFLFSRQVIVALAIYIAVSCAFVGFAGHFSHYESQADGRGSGPTWESLTYFSAVLPTLLTSGTALAGMTGLCVLYWRKLRNPMTGFWLSWLLGYTVFKLLVPTSNEPRHFFMALPAFAGLIGALLDAATVSPAVRWVGSAVVFFGLVVNIVQDRQTPLGVVGYETVAARLGVMDKSGNILASSPEEPDLLFRYRCLYPGSPRQFLRGDRTLAIRLPSYAHVAPQALCDSKEDVVRLVLRGRVRYLVTCLTDAGEPDDRPSDMVLAHEAASSLPREFTLIEDFPLVIDFGRRGRHYRIFVWEYQGRLPEGPSEVPVVIPTAGMEL